MGHHNLHFGGDQHALRGHWSPPTSRANFCEEDYVVTFYLAEFINSISNLAYIYLALKAMYYPTTTTGRRQPSPWSAPPKIDFMSLSLLLLGIGSILFHATLRQTLEFSDELSMLCLTWSMLQAVLTARQTPSRARFISVILGIIYLSFSAFYIHSARIIYQVIAFATGIGLVTLRSQYLFHRLTPPFPEDKSRDWNVRTWQAIGICLVGYVLWNIDLEYCMELRALRARLGLPWAWGLELHGWWHCLTAVGAARFMDVAREVREEVEREKEDAKVE
ncbi:ceramidase [Echria macrotheca]|uniref:Ceramidase n=1 Tax=Echria macrotheca TaxID=438768 RepID=A0AAJ0BG75_9PEZI|nr:ceramidase [Echria macrotheca]